MYRFGDGTPFPLKENFIDTIVAAVDCCAALYRAEVETEEREVRIIDAQKSAAEELKRLDALKSLIETAVSPMTGRKDSQVRPSDLAASRILDSAESILRQTRETVSKRHETATHDQPPIGMRERVRSAVSDFFRGHALPRTEWRVRWQAPISTEASASAEIGAQATRDLELTFQVSPESDSGWARPIRLADLMPGVAVDTTVDLGKGKRRSVRLDAFVITEISVAPGRESMVLRESDRKASPGLHIVMPRGADTAPLAVYLDKRDRSRSQPFCLDEPGSIAMHHVWGTIEEKLPELVALRGPVSTSRLRGRDCADIEHPSEVAEAILMALAPLVRDMRMRSRVPGELILKRDLAGDRREEMFVPRKVLWSKLESLPLRHRQIFESMGLGTEATCDFVTRVAAVKPLRSAARGTEPRPALERGAYTIDEPATFGGESDTEDTHTRPNADRFTAVSGIIVALPAVS